MAVSPAEQREVAQILILNDQGVPVPKQRIRHLLAQPIPGAEDQSVATEEQWQAALDRAETWHDQVQDPAADWFALGTESDDLAHATMAATWAGTTRPPDSSCPSSRRPLRGWRWVRSASQSGPTSATTSSR